VLKIQLTSNHDVVLTVSGRLEADNVGELAALLEAGRDERTVVLDLKDLTLADDNAICYLGACERDGAVLRNCPPYIRTLIAREQNLS